MTKPDDTIRVLIPLNLKTAVTPQWQGLSGGFEGGLSALPPLPVKMTPFYLNHLGA